MPMAFWISFRRESQLEETYPAHGARSKVKD